MKPPPSDPFALHARMMSALIDDILDPVATTFPRLDALREVSKLNPAVEWLERAGPIARKLNEDAKHD